jgi:hypothetical protein
MSYSFLYDIEHYHLIDENHNGLKGFEQYVENPVKLKKGNNKDVLSKLFGSVCSCYVRQLATNYLRDDADIMSSYSYKEMKAELYGVKLVCFQLGLGYYGACNTPTEIENLNWFADLTMSKTLYLALLKNGVEMPDFQFIRSRMYK